MAVVLPNGRNYFTDSSGNPLVGGRLYCYVPGTSTPKAAYTTSAGTTPHTNPIVLDARGEAAIYWTGAYDVVLRTSADALIWGPERLEQPETAGLADALRDDLANDASAAEGAGLIGYGPSLSYVAGTVGAKLNDFVSVKDYGAVGDGVTNDTAAMQAAHDAAEGRRVFYPRGQYLFTTITLNDAGGGIIGDSVGDINGDNGTELLTATSGNAITLATSTAHNVLLKDFTLRQTGSVQGKGLVAADCYWLRTENVRVIGFVDNLYMSLSLYHHHRKLFSEDSTNGVNYWGASGTWNTDWFNNVLTFDTCRFTDCTVTGATIKGCEVVFIGPDFSNMSTTGAIGLECVGESTSFRAHGIKLISPYAENTKIIFSFQYAKVEIDGGGYIQGGSSAPNQAKSIIDADESIVLWSAVEDKDYFEYGYRLTNNSTLTFRNAFSGSIRSTNSADATSKVLTDDYDEGSYTATLTGCTTSPTATVQYVRKGKMVTLYIPGVTATSNTTGCSLTGGPANIRPTNTQYDGANVVNNGGNVLGSCAMFSSGTIVLYNGAAGTAFTNSGTKGVGDTTINYILV